MSREEIVSRSEDVMHGALVFTGTRVPAESLIAHLRAGDRLDDFLDGFPSVSREQAEAFLDLAQEPRCFSRAFAELVGNWEDGSWEDERNAEEICRELEVSRRDVLR